MRRLGFVLLILGLLGSLIVSWQRLAWEEKSYSLVYDYAEALNMARLTDTSIHQVLRSLKEAGVTAVAISHYTAGQAVRQGRLLVFDGISFGELPQQLRGVAVKPGKLYIIPKSQAVSQDLKGLLPSLGGKLLDREQNLWELSESLERFLEQPLGLPEDKLSLAKSLNLGVVVRFKNHPAFGREAIAYLISSGQGAQAFLPEGDKVLGYPRHLHTVAEELAACSLPLAMVEFANINGQESLARAAGPNILRLHSIPAEELSTMTPERARERLVRARAERSIPLLYLRPLFTGEDLLAENTAFVAGVREKLEALGFSAASVRPRAPWSSSLGLFWLAALGPVGACLILAQKLPRALQRLLLLLLAIAWLGLPLLHLLRARQLFALLAAVVFPVLGVVVGKKLTASGQVKAAAAGLVALAGGVVVSALLGSWQFALAVWRFAGVKVAFLLPVGLVGLWAISPLGEGGSWDDFKKWCERQLAEPLRVWHVLLGLLLLLVLFVYILRSGNTGLAAPWERAAREFLERTFRYRPRTKELLCYPLLVLAFAGKPSLWQRLLLPLGTIALVSTVNTFAHAHSPLAAGLVRSFWGILLGLVFGSLLNFLVGKVTRRG